MAHVQMGTAAILKQHRNQILTDWMKELSNGLQSDGRISKSELSDQTREFLNLLQSAFSSDGIADVESESWVPVREFLDGISRSRAQQGFSSAETATFIFSLKKPLFDFLRQELGNDPKVLADEIWNATELLDHLGLHTIRTFQKAREDVISRQQEELLELSTPVVKVWDGILALPLIGTLDSARTQIVMESLLQKIVDTTPAPNETECGDAWHVRHDERRLSAIVVDGLGHGPFAAIAATEALRVFIENAFDSPVLIWKLPTPRCAGRVAQRSQPPRSSLNRTNSTLPAWEILRDVSSVPPARANQ